MNADTGSQHLNPILPVLLSSSIRQYNPPRALLAPADLAPLVATNPALAAGVVGALLAGGPSDASKGTVLAPRGVSDETGFTPGAAGMKTSAILSALVRLPPTLPTFDVLGRLLRDARMVADVNDDLDSNPSSGVAAVNGNGGASLSSNSDTTIADLIRTDVLGRFVAASIDWLDNAEREEREGRASEDTWAQGVVHVRLFFSRCISAGGFRILFL